MNSVFLEIFIILLVIGTWFYLHTYKKDTLALKKMSILFIGVLLFQIMSEPMWGNNNLSSWTYLIYEISWILTMGWTVIFIFVIELVDKVWKKYSEKIRFFLYLIILTIITTPIEVILLNLGIRSYDTVLTKTMSGLMIPFTSAPIEIIFTIMLIGALVIPFYRVMLEITDKD